MSQVRVSESTHEALRSLSLKEGKTMQDIIDKAVEYYRRKTFLQGLSEDFQALRANPEDWQEYQAEMTLWDNTLQDGLENE
jgi:hypothetical protein